MNAAAPSRQSPSVTLQFSAAERVYEPLEPLEVRFQITVAPGSVIRAIERSVLWYTEGKGEEDLGIHQFDRVTDPAAVAAAVTDGRFATRLPRSPLSYEGLIVKIRWCVRIRLFFESGRDFVSEHVFDLGRIPAAVARPAS
ncbi:MAG: hypothetical protein RLZZ440_1570 [Planctomycetota bacterium]